MQKNLKSYILYLISIPKQSGIAAISVIILAAALFGTLLGTVAVQRQTRTQGEAAGTGTYSVRARVYVDNRCNNVFESGTDRALGGADVTLIKPDGTSETNSTISNGYVNFSEFNYSGGNTATVEVNWPTSYTIGGTTVNLRPCYNSPGSISLTERDFGSLSNKVVTFRLERTTQVQPTEPAATNTPVPTDEPAAETRITPTDEPAAETRITPTGEPGQCPSDPTGIVGSCTGTKKRSSVSGLSIKAVDLDSENSLKSFWVEWNTITNPDLWGYKIYVKYSTSTEANGIIERREGEFYEYINKNDVSSGTAGIRFPEGSSVFPNNDNDVSEIKTALDSGGTVTLTPYASVLFTNPKNDTPSCFCQTTDIPGTATNLESNRTTTPSNICTETRCYEGTQVRYPQEVSDGSIDSCEEACRAYFGPRCTIGKCSPQSKGTPDACCECNYTDDSGTEKSCANLPTPTPISGNRGGGGSSGGNKIAACKNVGGFCMSDQYPDCADRPGGCGNCVGGTTRADFVNPQYPDYCNNAGDDRGACCITNATAAPTRPIRQGATATPTPSTERVKCSSIGGVCINTEDACTKKNGKSKGQLDCPGTGGLNVCCVLQSSTQPPSEPTATPVPTETASPGTPPLSCTASPPNGLGGVCIFANENCPDGKELRTDASGCGILSKCCAPIASAPSQPTNTPVPTETTAPGSPTTTTPTTAEPTTITEPTSNPTSAQRPTVNYADIEAVFQLDSSLLDFISPNKIQATAQITPIACDENGNNCKEYQSFSKSIQNYSPVSKQLDSIGTGKIIKGEPYNATCKVSISVSNTIVYKTNCALKSVNGGDSVAFTAKIEGSKLVINSETPQERIDVDRDGRVLARDYDTIVRSYGLTCADNNQAIPDTDVNFDCRVNGVDLSLVISQIGSQIGGSSNQGASRGTGIRLFSK